MSNRLEDLYRIYVEESWDRSHHRASAQNRFNVDLAQILLMIARDLRELRVALEQPANALPAKGVRADR